MSEAFGGAAGASAVSSYNVAADGTLNTLTATSHTGQSAACWVAVNDNQSYAYATNTASGNISGYTISSSGRLSLLDPSGITATTDAGPIDVAFSSGSGYLYSLNAGGHSIGAFRVHVDGSLTSVAGATARRSRRSSIRLSR